MKPNLVFIMTDNQADWTLGCYGNEEIRTPSIDRIASEGMRFSDAYCVNSVCSPNRATCFTGLLPSQHGVHSYLGGESRMRRWERTRTARSESSPRCRASWQMRDIRAA